MKVIVLNLHGARADAFGAYGSSWVTTKHFDRLASEAVVFDHHYAEKIEPLLSRRFHPMGDHLRTILRTRRLPTALFCDERVSLGLDVENWKHVSIVQEQDLAVLEQPSITDGVFQQAIDWLQLFGVHYSDWYVALELGSLLPPWRESEYLNPNPQETSPGEQDESAADQDAPQGPIEAPPRFVYSDADSEDSPPERFGWRNAYAGVMQYVDDLVGQFLNLLRELGLDQECLIAVTSPHGLPLGERGGAPARHQGLHEEVIHLPLIVRFPQAQGAGRRVHHLTQPVDCQATLLDAFGLEYQTYFDHPVQSLSRFTQGSGGRIREFAVTWMAQTETALRTADWSFLLPQDGQTERRPPQLYRQPEDRWEMNNVIKEHPDVAEHLELTLRRLAGWPGQESPPHVLPLLRDDLLKRQQS